VAIPESWINKSRLKYQGMMGKMKLTPLTIKAWSYFTSCKREIVSRCSSSVSEQKPEIKSDEIVTSGGAEEAEEEVTNTTT
jgi:hypothetical protein